MLKFGKTTAPSLAIALLLVGCSSASGPQRASLNGDGGASAMDYANGSGGQTRLSDVAPIRYYSGPSSSTPARLPAIRDSRIAPRVGPPITFSPAQVRPNRPDGTPLRRYAAMPRHKPYAAHVRQHEPSCLQSGIVQTTAFIRPRSRIGGGQCYISKPFSMLAAADGRVRFEPAATVRCQMVPSVETWVSDVLRPAARQMLGSDIVKLRIAASYACRSRNHKAGARLSEHGRANAIDISKFHLADGRVITVKQGWRRGTERERRFLRYIHRGACEHFSTVLGPNADRYHHDHFHFDLANHGRRQTYRVCK